MIGKTCRDQKIKIPKYFCRGAITINEIEERPYWDQNRIFWPGRGDRESHFRQILHNSYDVVIL